MLALSTCWNNHRFSDGMDLAKEIRAMGFEWIEISHGTKVSLLPGLLNAYQQGIVRVTSLHNFCPSPVHRHQIPRLFARMQSPPFRSGLDKNMNIIIKIICKLSSGVMSWSCQNPDHPGRSAIRRTWPGGGTTKR